MIGEGRVVKQKWCWRLRGDPDPSVEINFEPHTHESLDFNKQQVQYHFDGAKLQARVGTLRRLILYLPNMIVWNTTVLALSASKANLFISEDKLARGETTSIGEL